MESNNHKDPTTNVIYFSVDFRVGVKYTPSTIQPIISSQSATASESSKHTNFPLVLSPKAANRYILASEIGYFHSPVVLRQVL
mmetsp:Transcript_24259/g.46487  ORF Transcript_24259/g.46487 Transcript_24259/m.46487 type:complete len:83 (+) Transcript_24259:1-249(+)